MKTNSRFAFTRAALVALAILPAAAVASPYDLSWFTIDGGGGDSSFGPYSVSGTIGQADASPVMTGGGFEVQGGYWVVAIAPPCPADFNQDEQLDFFDYLDFVGFFAIEDPRADFNGDMQVDFFDYLDFVGAFDAGC
jgi:hypothetical protein